MGRPCWADPGWGRARPVDLAIKFPSDMPQPDPADSFFQRMRRGPAHHVFQISAARPGPFDFQIMSAWPGPAIHKGGAAHETRALYGWAAISVGWHVDFTGRATGRVAVTCCLVINDEGICVDVLVCGIFFCVFCFLMDSVSQTMSHTHQLPIQFGPTNGPHRCLPS